MRQIPSLIRSLIILPGNVLIVIPALILWLTRPTLAWETLFAHDAAALIAGALCVAFGLTLSVSTVQLFMTMGRGTPAPWDPPQRLVIAGPYRHVRNPMISGVLFILLGEALVLGSWPVFVWFLIFLGVNLAYIPLFEEPWLIRRYGEAYLNYTRHVPRWIPSLKGWDPNVP